MKTETIRLRLSAELVERIRSLAITEVRPLAKQIEYLLLNALKEGK